MLLVQVWLGFGIPESKGRCVMHSRWVGIKTVELSHFNNSASYHIRPFAAAVGRSCALLGRCPSGSRNQRRELRGKKRQSHQMCRNTKSNINDPTVAHRCLLIS